MVSDTYSAGPEQVGEMQRAPREFALMLSRRCNIACRHCGIESSPLVRDRMSLADAKRFIVEAAGLPDFVKVTFTGGEPTLVRRDLLVLLALCRDLRLSTRIVTNGWWARNKENGLQFLERLRSNGLTEINFSADRFHLEFTEAETLRNALECAHELGYPRIVSFVSNADRHPFEEFSESYGIPRGDLVDLRQGLEDGSSFGSLSLDVVHVFWGGLIGLGRAAQYPAELRYHPLDFFPQGVACGEVVNKPVIYPDGSFQACCCAGGKIAGFTVGNAFTESIADLYDKMIARSHFRLINDHGPRQLYEIMKGARPDRKLKDNYTSICQMCVESTRGVAAEEVDHIVDAWTLREMLVPFRAEAFEST